MRILRFETPDDGELFDVFMLALNKDERPHPRKELEKIGFLMDTMESIGVTLTEDDPTSAVHKKGSVVLKTFPAQVVLEEEPYEMLQQAMDATKWLGAGARVVSRAYRLLDAATHVTAKELTESREPLALVADTTESA